MTDAFPSATLEALQQRAELLATLRGFFKEHGYWEVETPLLSHETCVDQWIEPFQVQIGEQIAFLQTSPEFAMKRLLCAGAQAIYQITRSFRQDEVGQCHNPEFTIVEWYRVGDDHHAQMDFVESLAKAIGASNNFNNQHRLSSPFTRMTYDQAFQKFAGASVLTAPHNQLLDLAKHHNLNIPVISDRDQVLNQLLAEIVEPALKALGAVFLYDYPASQAALARIRNDAVPVAERFELYLDGIEICNGYHELTDANELRERMQQQHHKRQIHGLPALPVESRLLQAMELGLPDCSGVALGFDRLVMHCLGKQNIHDVIPFPFDRA